MSKQVPYWKIEYGLSISIDELRKAGFRTSQYAKHVQDVVFGAKKR